MYYALRIRILYQAPKARRRGLCTTHYVSVLCIQAPHPSAGLCVRAGGESAPQHAALTAPPHPPLGPDPNFALPLGLP